MIGRRRGGISLGRMAKKAAVATVVSRTVNNVMDNRANRNLGNQQNINQQPPQQNHAAMTNMCPSCNGANPQHAKFCLNCGGGIGAAQPASVQPQPTAPPATCSGCKASLVGINGKFCPYCRTGI